jgi:hypothetical protein
MRYIPLLLLPALAQAQVTGLPCGYTWDTMASIEAENKIEATPGGYKVVDRDTGAYCYVVVLTHPTEPPVLSNVACNVANSNGIVVDVTFGNAEGYSPVIFRATDPQTPEAPRDMLITCLRQQLDVLLAMQ